MVHTLDALQWVNRFFLVNLNQYCLSVLHSFMVLHELFQYINLLNLTNHNFVCVNYAKIVSRHGLVLYVYINLYVFIDSK